MECTSGLFKRSLFSLKPLNFEFTFPFARLHQKTPLPQGVSVSISLNLEGSWKFEELATRSSSSTRFYFIPASGTVDATWNSQRWMILWAHLWGNPETEPQKGFKT